MSIELAIIIAVIGVTVSITTIISFVLGRKDKGKQEGVEHGEISNNIKYIMQAQTNILLGQKEMTAKLDKVNEEVIILKVKEKNLEDKEEALEKRIEKLEKRKGE